MAKVTPWGKRASYIHRSSIAMLFPKHNVVTKNILQTFLNRYRSETILIAYLSGTELQSQGHPQGQDQAVVQTITFILVIGYFNN